MDVKAEAFVKIEDLLARKLSDVVLLRNYQLFDLIQEALDANDFDAAERGAEKISVADVAYESKGLLTYMTNLGMLFGAAQVSQKPGTSKVQMGFEKDTTATLVQSLTQSLAFDVELTLRESALQLISLRRHLHEKVKKAEGDLLVPFQSFIDKVGNAQFNLVSSLHTSRASAYGFTAEASALGLTEYEINEQLDSRICPVCTVMHRKRFNVVDARNFLDIVTRTQDAQQLKFLQPWPKQSKDEVAKLKAMRSEELVAKGWHVPPFHPRCRGLLNRVGTAPALPGVRATPVAEEHYQSVSEDFEGVGLHPSQEVIDAWNSNLGLPPNVVIENLQGRHIPPEDITGESSSASNLSLTNGSILLQLTGRLGDSTADATFSMTAGPDQIRVNSLRVGPRENGSSIARTVMQGTVNTALMAGISTVIIRAAGSQSYAWARYGFLPTTPDWESMKKDLAVKAFGAGGPPMAPESRAYLAQLLQSDEPEAITLIAAMTEEYEGVSLGEYLLADTDWTAFLDLADQNSLEMFTSYFGGK